LPLTIISHISKRVKFFLEVFCHLFCSSTVKFLSLSSKNSFITTTVTGASIIPQNPNIRTPTYIDARDAKG